MEYTVVGRVENDTAMTRSFTCLIFRGVEVDVVSFMLQEGLDIEECGFISDHQDVEQRFQPNQYFGINKEETFRERTLHLDGINPSIFTEELRTYAEREEVEELSTTAFAMAETLELGHVRRLKEIETFLAKTSFV